MFYIIVGIGVVAVLFPGLFDFVVSVLSFIWDVIGTVVMFFVNLFRFILIDAGFLDFLGDSLAFLLRALGTILSPIQSILPDHPIVSVVLLVLLGIAFLALDRSAFQMDAHSADASLKLTYAWCFSALNLGMMAAGSGHPHRSLCGVIDTYFTDHPMTLFNFPEWSGFAKGMLWLTLIGGLLISIFFACVNGPRSFIRTWTGLTFCGVLGFVLMRARLSLCYWLIDMLGFLGSLVNIAVGFLETIVIIQFFFGIVVFLMPGGMILAINEANSEKRSRQSSSRQTFVDTDDEDPFLETDDFPVYLSDDDGNNYHVEQSGDFIYIYLPDGGRISTKWEYVKGHPYFDLEGKRFYPH